MLDAPAERQSPLLVLCPPRSYSSVFCAMLGQHPALYGFPELNLFLTDTVGALLDLQNEEVALTGEHALGYTSGIVRSVAELLFGAQTPPAISQARAWLLERAGWTTRELFDFLLGRIAPRIGVDKSPRSPMSSASLRRVERYYPQARIIHLTRHPRATWQSLVDAHVRFASTSEHAVSPALLSHYAQVVCAAHQRILDLLAAWQPSQHLRVKGEELLQNPEGTLTRILTWLQADRSQAAIEGMLRPERSPFAFAGLPGIAHDNDIGFLENPRLRAAASILANADIRPEGVSKQIWLDLQKMARTLGY